MIITIINYYVIRIITYNDNTILFRNVYINKRYLIITIQTLLNLLNL